VLSGRGLCDELIIRREESYRLWCVVVCGLENLLNEETLGYWRAVGQKKKKSVSVYLHSAPSPIIQAREMCMNEV
jgi:hypothetical protein